MTGPAPWITWHRPEVRERLGVSPVAVLMGGTSAERGVSLSSGESILRSLADLSGPSWDLAPAVTAVEIAEGGQWVIDGLALAPERAIGALPEDTLWFLALHGGSGEDGRVQAFLEVAGRTHTGASPATSSLCMDKHRSRLVASAAGVAVADGAFVTRSAFQRDPAGALARLRAATDGVAFVKHCAAGSSFGVYRCTSADEVERAASEIVESGGDVLLEAEVVGLETTAGLIGDGASAHALPIVEIVPGEGAFFDYEQKYAAAGGARETCPPEQLSAAVCARIQDRARRAWDAFGGTGYGRIDFIVPRRADGSIDEGAEPVMLEPNTLPGFTPRSLLPLAAAADGATYREVVLEVLARAIAAG